MGLERSESRQEVNRFQYTGLSLGIVPGKQNDPSWDVHIQAGKTAKIGEREVGEVH